MKGIQEYRRQQGKVQEVEVLKGWKVGEIGGNYATIFNILLSKNKAKKKGLELGMQGIRGARRLGCRVVKSSRLPAKIAAYLVSIGQLLCLAFLYGWRF